MALHTTTKGIDLPIAGTPVQQMADGPRITQVAFVGDDFPGIKPQLFVEVGDRVRRGQVLVVDRATPEVKHTATGAGKIVAINRGKRRVLRSIVIELSDGERNGQPGDDECHPYTSFAGENPDALRRRQIVTLLAESGAFPAFRTRPFGKVPHPDSTPDAIFVTAMDSNPLAADPEVILAHVHSDFEVGLRLVARLTDGPTYLCVRRDSNVAKRLDAPISVEEFDGPHPAGTAGYHVHCLRPVSRRHTVWTVGYQDVVAIARLFQTGRLDVSRVIAIGGPPVRKPRLVRTRLGAAVPELAAGEETSESVRWVSGSVLSGKAARGPVFGFVGRYDLQLCAVYEDSRRELFGWCALGMNRFSVSPVFASRLFGSRRVEFTTSMHGSRRAMVPIGLYERVMPMDIMPTFLLRSLVVGDVERAEALGVLELCEEDVALCTFVCPGKTDYGPALRAVLDTIEAEW